MVTLFPFSNTIEVALEEEELAFHPLLDVYYSFLVKEPIRFSWSLAPLNGLNTALVQITNVSNISFFYYDHPHGAIDMS